MLISAILITVSLVFSWTVRFELRKANTSLKVAKAVAELSTLTNAYISRHELRMETQ